MATSYNGCPASPDPAVIHVNKDFHVQFGTMRIQFPGGVGQCQDLQDLFQYWEEQFFARVEHPITGVYSHDGDWGYEYRADVNAPGQLSCHASASATDTNAIWHPDGSAHTFNAAQYATIGQILAVELGHTLRIGSPGLLGPDGKPVGWTADSTPDEMHVEAVSFDPQRWAAVAGRIRPLLGKGAAGQSAKGNPRSTDGASITYPGLTVAACQTLLNAAGASPKLATDGVLGPLTAHAIRDFQARHGLVVDGIVGPKTDAALEAAQPRKRPAAPYPLRYPQVFGVWNYPGTDGRTGNLWRGETRSGDPRWDPQSIRNQVKLIQGAVGSPVDGIYGPHTQTAVQHAQAGNHLAADGLVGPHTWAVLFR